MTAATLPQDGSRHVPVLAVIGFVVAMVGAIAVAFPMIERVDTILPATVMSAFSVFSFFHCGGRVVNASSVASYGVFMFIGFPAIFAALGLYDSRQAFTPNSLLIVLILAFIFLALLVLISATGGPDNSSVGRNSDPSVESRVFRLSLLVLLCALGAHVLGGVPRCLRFLVACHPRRCCPHVLVRPGIDPDPWCEPDAGDLLRGNRVVPGRFRPS